MTLRSLGRQVDRGPEHHAAAGLDQFDAAPGVALAQRRQHGIGMQGIAVIELAHRYPGEGGVYLWAKEVFGDFHGFLSGWCYWTNNMLYVPTVMLYFVGVSVYVLGPAHPGTCRQ